MKPDTSQHSRWTWLQINQGPRCEGTKIRGPKQKMRKLARQGALSKKVEKTTSRVHMQKGASQQLTEKRRGAYRGRNGSGPVGLGQPTWPISGPVHDAIWHRCFSINCLCLRRPPHPSIHQRVAKTKEKDQEAHDGHRESSRLSRRWPRPTLAAMAALHDWSMVEFRASWGYQWYVLGADDLNIFIMWVKYFMSSDLLATRFLLLWFCFLLTLSKFMDVINLML
jgi:hypothetical protein